MEITGDPSPEDVASAVPVPRADPSPEDVAAARPAVRDDPTPEDVASAVPGGQSHPTDLVASYLKKPDEQVANPEFNTFERAPFGQMARIKEPVEHNLALADGPLGIGRRLTGPVTAPQAPSITEQYMNPPLLPEWREPDPDVMPPTPAWQNAGQPRGMSAAHDWESPPSGDVLPTTGKVMVGALRPVGETAQFLLRPALEGVIRHGGASFDAASSLPVSAEMYIKGVLSPNEGGWAERAARGVREADYALQAGGQALDAAVSVFNPQAAADGHYYRPGDSIAEFITRAAMSTWGGQEAMMRPDSPEFERATHELVKHFGDNGAAAIQWAAQTGGELPILLFNPGAEAASVGGRAVGEAVAQLPAVTKTAQALENVRLLGKLSPTVETLNKVLPQMGEVVGRAVQGAGVGAVAGAVSGEEDLLPGMVGMGGLSAAHSAAALGGTLLGKVLPKHIAEELQASNREMGTLLGKANVKIGETLSKPLDAASRKVDYIIGLWGKQVEAFKNDLWTLAGKGEPVVPESVSTGLALEKTKAKDQAARAQTMKEQLSGKRPQTYSTELENKTPDMPRRNAIKWQDDYTQKWVGDGRPVLNVMKGGRLPLFFTPAEIKLELVGDEAFFNFLEVDVKNQTAKSRAIQVRTPEQYDALLKKYPGVPRDYGKAIGRTGEGTLSVHEVLAGSGVHPDLKLAIARDREGVGVFGEGVGGEATAVGVDQAGKLKLAPLEPKWPTDPQNLRRGDPVEVDMGGGNKKPGIIVKGEPGKTNLIVVDVEVGGAKPGIQATGEAGEALGAGEKTGAARPSAKKTIRVEVPSSAVAAQQELEFLFRLATSGEGNLQSYMETPGARLTPARVAAAQKRPVQWGQWKIEQMLQKGTAREVAPGIYARTANSAYGAHTAVAPKRTLFLDEGSQKAFGGVSPPSPPMEWEPVKVGGADIRRGEPVYLSVPGLKKYMQGERFKDFFPKGEPATNDIAEERITAWYRGPGSRPGYSKIAVLEDIPKDFVPEGVKPEDAKQFRTLELPNQKMYEQRGDATIEVPDSVFRTARPLGFADKPLAPLPLDQTMPLEYGPQAKAALERWKKSTELIRRAGGESALKRWFEAQIKNPLLASWQLGGAVGGPGFARIDAAKKVMPTEHHEVIELLKPLFEQYGGMRGPAAWDALAISEAAPGEARTKAALAFLEKYPEIAQERFKLMMSLLQELKDRQARLANYGIDAIARNEILRGEGLSPEYLTQVWEMYTMPPDMREPFARKDGRWEVFKKHMALKRPTATDAELDAELRNIISAPDPLQTAIDNGYLQKGKSGSPKNNLLSRKDLSPEYKAFLGEMSMPWRLAESISKVRFLDRYVSVFDELSQSPYATYSRTPQTPYQIPDQPIFGRAKGMWVPKEFATFFDVSRSAKESAGIAYLWRVATTWFKRNMTVFGGVTPWVNNVARGLRGDFLTGTGMASDPKTAIKYGVEMARMMRGIHEDPTVFGPNGRLILAREYGVLESGAHSVSRDFQNSYIGKKLMQALEEGAAKGPVNALDRILNTAQESGRMAKVGIDEMTAAYGMVDEWFKGKQFLELYDRFQGQGLSPNAAAARASHIVRQSNPNYGSLSPVAAGIRDNFAIMNEFGHASYEDMRVWGTVVSRLMKSHEAAMRGDFASPDYDPQLAISLAKMGLVVGGAIAYGRELQRAGGMTDERREAAVNTITTRNVAQTRTPFLTTWIRPDEKGRPLVVDPAHTFEPILHLFSRAPGDPVIPAFIRAAFQEFTGGPEKFAGAIVEQATSPFGLTPRPNWLQKPNPSDTFAQAAGRSLLSGGVLPGVVSRGFGLDKVMNPGLRSVEALTGGEAAAKFLGAPIVGAVGPMTRVAQNLELRSAGNEIKKILKQFIVEHTPRGGTMSEADRAEFHERLKKLTGVYGETAKHIREALTAEALQERLAKEREQR